MYRETVPSRQLGAWLAAGLCPVAVQFAAPMEWTKVAAATVVCLTAVWIVWRWGSFERWTAIPACVLLVIYTGQILKESASVWIGNSYPAVPLMLLGLALWSSLKGASASARVGAVLFWVVVIIYPIVFGAAIRDVHWQWVGHGEALKAELVLLLLIPSLGKMMLKGESGIKRLVLPGIFASVASLLTVGILSRGDFYEMVRSIDLLGVVKHFEALISAGAMLGWFAMLNYILTVCAGTGDATGRGRVYAVVASLGVALWMLCDLHISFGILLAFGAVFWVLTPVLTQGIATIKNS